FCWCGYKTAQRRIFTLICYTYSGKCLIFSSLNILMIHRITLMMIVICLSLNVSGQPAGVSKLRPDVCSDIAYSSSIAFTGFMKNLQYDAAKHVLQYWESKCGLREPVFRAQVMLTLVTAQDVDSLVNKESLFFLK